MAAPCTWGLKRIYALAAATQLVVALVRVGLRHEVSGPGLDIRACLHVVVVGEDISVSYDDVSDGAVFEVLPWTALPPW
jgi:hypothetical protein